MKHFLKIFLKNIIVYIVMLLLDSIFTAFLTLISSAINHIQYSTYDFYSNFMRFFFYGIILFIWFALPAIILFNIFVFSKKEWFKRVIHYILLGALLGCLSFAIGGGLFFENRFEVIIGTIHYAIMGGIYAWIFYLIIIKPLKRRREKHEQEILVK